MRIEELKAWRKKQGLTQTGLAEMLKTTHVTISRWETGVHPIPPFLDLALAELENRLAADPSNEKTKKRKEVKKSGNKDSRKKTRRVVDIR